MTSQYTPLRRSSLIYPNGRRNRVTYGLYLDATGHPEYAYGHGPLHPPVMDGPSFGFGVSCGEDINGFWGAICGNNNPVENPRTGDISCVSPDSVTRF